MEGRTVRQWAFWRAGFWRRPILVVAASLALIAGSPFPLAWLPDALAAGRALDAGRLCSTPHAPSEPCLRWVEGTLEGPRHSRGPDTEWWLRPRFDSSKILDFNVSPSSPLTSGMRVAVLTYGYDEKLIAGVAIGDSVVRTSDVGIEGAMQDVVLAVGMFLGGVILVGYGISSWRRTGSAFAVNGHGWDDSTLSRVCRYGGSVTFTVALLAAVPVFYGARWWVGLLTPVLLAGVLLLVRLTSIHRQRASSAG